MNVFIPITTAQMRIKRSNVANQVDMIIVQAKNSESVDLAIRDSNTIMRDSHRLSARQPNDFTITNQQDFLSIA